MLQIVGSVRTTTMAASRVAQRLSNLMHLGAPAACLAFATRLAVLRTGNALLGYGGLAQALL